MAEKVENILEEKWVKGIAITTTVLAVVAAIASSRSSYFVAKAQLLTALEGSQWAYYQSKSIKEDLFATEQKSFQADSQGATTPEQRDFLTKNINEYTKNIAHYDQDKATIKAQAEATHQENGIVVKKGSQFSLAVVFAQIGIMLSSVGALLKRKEIWLIGLIIGFISLIFLANGFLLVF